MSAEDELLRVLAALSPDRTYRDMEKLVEEQLASLLASGTLAFSAHHLLGGPELEAHVRLLLGRTGFPGTRTPNQADLIVQAPSNAFEPGRPLVIEIKSGKQAGPSREHLRQLDDWVFELSGEDRARRTNRVYAHAPGIPTRVHRSPHKGVFIFNGPMGTRLSDRSHSWLGANEQAFAEKRFFCLIRFETLLKWSQTCGTETGRQEFWKVVQETAGALREP